LGVSTSDGSSDRHLHSWTSPLIDLARPAFGVTALYAPAKRRASRAA
jgi:hypothetical protein